MEPAFTAVLSYQHKERQKAHVLGVCVSSKGLVSESGAINCWLVKCKDRIYGGRGGTSNNENAGRTMRK